LVVANQERRWPADNAEFIAAYNAAWRTTARLWVRGEPADAARGRPRYEQ